MTVPPAAPATDAAVAAPLAPAPNQVRLPHAEFAARRNRVLEALEELGGAIGLVFAGDHDVHLSGRFRPHPHFEYLTGITQEPGAVLVLDPRAPVAARRACLLLKPLDPELEQWDGLRDTIGSKLRAETGFGAVFRTRMLPRLLGEACGRDGAAKRFACLHPLAWHDQPVSPDLAVFRKVVERVPGAEIVDAAHVVGRLRSVKSDAEVDMLREASRVTELGFRAAMRACRPGMSELALLSHLQHAWQEAGSPGTAYDPIVGSGVRSTVLHYKDNDHAIDDGDVICIDAGTMWGGYGADVTRTIPANGRFTDRQREIHDLVDRALEASLAVVKAGATFAEIDEAARSIIRGAGHGDAFIHGIGHHLGLETHDVNPGGPLEAGAVITVEPGIYLPDEKIGVRIEDDVVVTDDGHENLTRTIPRTADEIEAFMAG